MKTTIKNQFERFVATQNKILTPLEVITCVFIIAGVIRHWN